MIDLDELIAEVRKVLEDYPNYQEYPGGPLLKYPHQDALMRVANALEAAEARVKELEAGVWEYAPAWEYGYRDWYTDRHPTKAGQRMERPKRTYRTPDNWLPELGEIYRRRPSLPAGPWLPVEGESK